MLTEDELKEHGYPLPCPERPGRAVVFAVEEKKLTDGELCWTGEFLTLKNHSDVLFNGKKKRGQERNLQPVYSLQGRHPH